MLFPIPFSLPIYSSLPLESDDRGVVPTEFFSLVCQFFFGTGVFFLAFCFIISIYRRATTLQFVTVRFNNCQCPNSPRQTNRYLGGINLSSRTRFPFDIPLQITRFFHSTHGSLPPRPSSQGSARSPPEVERFIWVFHSRVIEFPVSRVFWAMILFSYE